MKGLEWIYNIQYMKNVIRKMLSKLQVLPITDKACFSGSVTAIKHIASLILTALVCFVSCVMKNLNRYWIIKHAQY